MGAPQSSLAAGRVAFTYPSFGLYQLARFCIVLATEMQSVAVGWQVYEITKRPLDLGLVGLAQFLPGVLLFLVSGHMADRYDRRKLVVACYVAFAGCSGLLMFAALHGTRTVYPIYVVLILIGVVRAFNGPVSRALLPELVPEEHFQNAVAWASSVFQTATILGPSVGGIVYAVARGPAAVYTLAAAAALVAASCAYAIKVESRARGREPLNTQSVLAGLHYIWREKLILGAISLDLFAVLLGGAVALLPVYAREILMTGPWGLGILRSAPGIGAAGMAVYLAHKPLGGRVGVKMLWCVTGFGVFTILFGISRSLTLSLIALILVGATDMVSVIVNAVDMVFIGASNELGQFESGLTAHWFGTVAAVVLGGVGTLAVTAVWAWLFPDLRRADRLTGLMTTQAEENSSNVSSGAEVH
jgi:MFS family permease